ncbi:hypothetical protein BDR05DRAFT_1006279 [Suillus weaverae]|nr:hypothetical protein BDR05DRAFT_1006279 [Suillus weaverae]
MPPTKMTARKSNGGTAPRVKLGFPVEDSSLVPDEVMDACDGFQHNDFCIVCRDGSTEPNSLICCSTCPRVTCLKCMDIPRRFQQAILGQDVTFNCIVCHMVEQQQVEQRHEPYFGFYKGGRPVLDKFLPILATLEVSLRAQISSATALFIHLALVDNDTTGGPFNLAYKFLKPYFPRGGIAYHEVTFDIATVSKATSYQEQVNKLVHALLKQRPWSRVVIGITNHTDNETGDPFAGYVNEKYISGAVDNFLAILLKPWQVLINRADESFLWFFSCGGLVNNLDSFAALQKSLLFHHVTASIAFTAPRFQPGFTCHLLFAFVEHVLIERISISQAFPHMLGQSYKLGRHTDIFLMTTDALSGGLAVTKYSWTHIDHRPWGQYLPIQCPGCGWVDSWRSATKARVYAFECTNDSCRKSFTFKQPEGSKILIPGKTGSSCWLAIPWNSSV